MKVLYIAPRFHTNQAAIMKGWLNNGHEVRYFSQYVGKTEDYTDIRPLGVGYAKLFKLWDFVWTKVIRRHDEYAKDMKLRWGFPPLFKLARLIRGFAPDIVIIRERSVYAICATAICRFYGFPTILYNLSPVWDHGVKNDIPHRIVRLLTPKHRMTPVELRGIDYAGLVKIPHSHFAPFVMEPQVALADKVYFQNGRINLFSVGKYQKRKNHRMLLAVFTELLPEHNLHLTIAGEVSDKFHRKYLAALKKYIAKRQLEDKVTLLCNLSSEEMRREYRKADIHIQPATAEPAGSTIVEAMAFALPVVSGSDNGTASYITPGVTGEVFRDGDKEDLKRKLESVIKDKENIPRMGAAGYQAVLDKHQFAGYYQVVRGISAPQNNV
jgi:glycosyltransferase involved in cell wall biosynthesis